jgi:iron-sulfur cluster assembly protein
MNIILTPEAIVNIKNLQKEYNAVGKGLRFGLSEKGCSGYKYILEFEDKPMADDMVLKFDEIVIYVSRSHFEKLKGSIIGWKDTLMESGFDIDNPQARQPCGCGESINFI